MFVSDIFRLYDVGGDDEEEAEDEDEYEIMVMMVMIFSVCRSRGQFA